MLFAAFIFPSREPQALALFVAFMAASSFRMVPIQALSSRVPAADERARFMSAQSVVQHLGSAVGAFTASRMLWQLPGSRLGGMDRVAWLAAILAAAVPGLLWLLEVRVRRGEGNRDGVRERRRTDPRRCPGLSRRRPGDDILLAGRGPRGCRRAAAPRRKAAVGHCLSRWASRYLHEDSPSSSRRRGDLARDSTRNPC